jgi:diguanylate cyclase (GGDEF)-like protein
MNVHASALARSAPFDPRDDREPPSGLHRRIVTLLAKLDRGTGQGGEPGDAALEAVSRKALLLGFTAAEIALGLGLLVALTITVPIGAAIASPALEGTALAGTTGGILLWTVFGLLGSVRTVSSADGAGHFTFHLPFVGAAMILGGPTAGAWVAFLATTDRRELQSQPWYGVLANHASIAIAAVVGGSTYVLVRGGLAAATGDDGLATFFAVLAAGVVLEVVANGLAIVTIKIRDDMTWSGVLGIVVDDFRSETLLEIALIWILVIASSTVGWWAPLAIGVAVVAYLGGVRSPQVDWLTGMVKEPTFLSKVDRKVGWMRLGLLPGGTMLMLDINNFRRFNNDYNYSVGNELILAMAARIKEVFPRQEDILSRLMGDEFAVFLVGLTDVAVAHRKVAELIATLERPIATSVGTQHITVAVGMVIAVAGGISTPSAAALLDRAVNSEQHAKGAKPESGSHEWAAGDAKVAQARATPSD